VSAVHLIDACRTLNESKGLEFNDVGLTFLHVYLITNKTKILLYNFFKDSTANLNQWRLVLNGISEGDNPFDAPTFDETRHASVCAEVCYPRSKLSFSSHSCRPSQQLKFLYVAITRARKNLWIVDDSESAGPMKVPGGSVFPKIILTLRVDILG